MIRLAIRAPLDAAEQVLGGLLEIAPAGIEQVDAPDGDAAAVEYAVYGAPGELPELAPGPATIGGVEVLVSGSEVGDDWAERWKAFHEPILIGDRLYVRPPWSEPRPDVALDLVIDPGRAFGTGAHATTRLCLGLLLEHADHDPPDDSTLCDLGCGSGVLAILAAKLGYARTIALDSDELAIDASLANAAANGAALSVVRRADLRREPTPAADVVVANLMRPLLLRVCALMDDPPRTLIASGLLDPEADEIAAGFAAHGFELRRRVSDGGWSALALRRGD